jgi:hypothetical protein
MTRSRWFLALVLSTLVACVPASTVLSPPAFEAGSVRLLRLDPPGVGADGLVLAVDATVRNPNAIGLTLRDVRLAMELGGAPVARSSLPAGLDLPASGRAPLFVEVAVPWSAAPGLVTDVAALLGGVPLPYRVEAAVDVDLLGVPQRFAGLTLAQGTLPPPGPWTPPSLRLDTRDARLALSGTTLSVEVGVIADNPGAIGVRVEAPSLDLRVDGRPLGRVEVAPTALPAGATVRLPLRIEVALSELGAALGARVAAGGEVSLALDGAWRFEAAGVELGRLTGWSDVGSVR